MTTTATNCIEFHHKSPLAKRCKVATSALIAASLILGDFVPNRAQAAYEDDYLSYFGYYNALYISLADAPYGNRSTAYQSYYLGLAVPCYFYYLAVSYSGYYSFHGDRFGAKGTGSSGIYVFQTYADYGDTFYNTY